MEMKKLDSNFDKLKQSIISKRLKAEISHTEAVNTHVNKVDDNSANKFENNNVNIYTNNDVNIIADKNANMDDGNCVNISVISDTNTNKIDDNSVNINGNSNVYSHINTSVNNDVNTDANNNVNISTNISTNTNTNTNVNKFVIKAASEETLIRYTIYLKPDTINKISQFAEQLNLGKSELVRKILEETLDNLEII
ncbi:MAG: CopG family transcriptional regulator [Bacillota bacterium]|nr:CopG family transcriptional regulator [Bacillota bacterium]